MEMLEERVWLVSSIGGVCVSVGETQTISYESGLAL